MAWFKHSSGADRSAADDIFDVAVDPLPAKPLVAGPAEPPRSAMPTPPPPRAEVPVAPRPAEPVVERSAAASVKPHTSILGPTLRFKGELRADEDFTLQGSIEGSIHHTQNLTIGPDGVVKGDSRALTIVVEGTVEGDLYALESITIRATARVLGNLFAPRVAISDGATFNGKVDMASATKAARAIVGRQSAAALGEREVDQVLSGT